MKLRNSREIRLLLLRQHAHYFLRLRALAIISVHVLFPNSHPKELTEARLRALAGQGSDVWLALTFKPAKFTSKHVSLS